MIVWSKIAVKFVNKILHVNLSQCCAILTTKLTFSQRFKSIICWLARHCYQRFFINKTNFAKKH